MADRRYRRTFFTARGRLELRRARYTFLRVSRSLNEEEPPWEQHRLDFYNEINDRISAHRAQTAKVAP